MKIELERKNEAFHFIGKSTNGTTVSIDSAPSIGGEDKGARPMELVLMAIGGCSSIDLGLILKKQRQNLEDYKIEVSAERKADAGKSFERVHLNFLLQGDLDPTKVEKAIALTVDKYCSVILSLRSDIEITTEFTINKN